MLFFAALLDNDDVGKRGGNKIRAERDGWEIVRAGEMESVNGMHRYGGMVQQEHRIQKLPCLTAAAASQHPHSHDENRKDENAELINLRRRWD